MGKILLSLTDETEQLFRATCKRLYGDKIRGGLSIGADQALKEWALKNAEP